MNENETNPELLTRLRDLVQGYREKHHHQTALFWADKVSSLSKCETCDVYTLAQCMYNAGEYERAALFIKGKNLHEKYNAFRYLAAKCYAEAKEWQMALDLLEDCTMQVLPKKFGCLDEKDVPGVPGNKEMLASIYLLKGDIYEAKDTRQFAAMCYEEALITDVFCYEAFERLIAHHLLKPSSEQAVIDSLPFSAQCKTEEEKKLLQFLYGTKTNMYSKPVEFEIPSSFDNLHENYEVASSLAERHYYCWEFRTSYKITSAILRADPYHTQCLPIHIALLVALKKSNELFYLAHRLVKRYPEKPISWYSVGCYYLLQPKKQELTRRYLLKATLVDKMYGPAWLALGHSFASEGEHDQAMAAYFTATQLMRGSHLPYLYSGLEYSVTNNYNLTDRFFDVAYHLYPDDPHVQHEIGVACFTINDYDAALKYFNKALTLLKANEDEVTSEEWEALLNNLGHTHRKQKNYELSLKYHEQALVLAPHSAQTYSSIGFVLSFMGRYGEALEYLHKSLGLRRDDVFAAKLMEHVIDQFAESELPVYGEEIAAEEDLGPPPPFPQTFDGNEKEDSDKEASEVDEKGIKEPHMQSSSLVDNVGRMSHQMGGAEVDQHTTDTSLQALLEGKTRLAVAAGLDDAADGFQTPEEFALGRMSKPVLCRTKKGRRMASSTVPPPLNFPSGSRDTPSTDESGLITPVLSRKMLTLVSSESSDDGGLLSMTPAEDDVGCTRKMSTRFRAPSTDDAWSTSVVKGGGGDFEGGEGQNVSDSVIMMLGDSASASDASLHSPLNGRDDAQTSTDNQPTTEQKQDEDEGADMEMDDTLDD